MKGGYQSVSNLQARFQIQLWATGLMPWVNSQLATRQPDEIRYIYQMSTRCQLGWFHVSSLHYRRRTRLSGALAKDAKTGNTLNGVVLKFMEPPEARVPSTK